jgi:hypothetical protein
MCFNARVSTSQEAPVRRRRAGRLAAAIAVIGVAALGVATAALVVPRILATPTPTAALGAPRYVEEAAAAGLEHVYDGDFSYFVGGGAAAFDCDDDGLLELYLAGGTRPATLFHNDSPIGGALRFTPLPAETTDLTAVTGAYPLDVDGDDVVDLAVLRHGENVILRGLGDCRFERANEAWAFDGGDEWTTAFSATWERDPNGRRWPSATTTTRTSRTPTSSASRTR